VCTAARPCEARSATWNLSQPVRARNPLRRILLPARGVVTTADESCDAGQSKTDRASWDPGTNWDRRSCTTPMRSAMNLRSVGLPLITVRPRPSAICTLVMGGRRAAPGGASRTEMPRTRQTATRAEGRRPRRSRSGADEKKASRRGAWPASESGSRRQVPPGVGPAPLDKLGARKPGPYDRTGSDDRRLTAHGLRLTAHDFTRSRSSCRSSRTCSTSRCGS